MYRIHCGEYRAEINPRGAGLKSLTFRGDNLVETYEEDQTPPMYAGLVLAPWPNRTADGHFTWKGQSYDLPVNEPERGNAIHGLVAQAHWQPVEVHGDSVRLTTPLRRPWPWAVNLDIEYRLDAHGLLIRLHADTERAAGADSAQAPEGEEPGAEPSPFAFGLHTFLSARGAATDECELSIPVSEHHLLDSRNLPTGEVHPARISHQRISEVNWDDCFRGEGPLQVDYVHPASGRGVRMEMGTGLDWVQLFTPDDYPGRGRALAVEPMSAPPNALVSGTDLATTPVDFELRLSGLG
ncbi:aldose epimerase [Corynebacterium sp.]|uniref:aldose epimerase family protein n=1 Tax=Corynebacterium sp. TaxID=1720 RepID=UPI0026DD7BA2|nr:aldose epimerase [Corynebacterium sp.]MDO5031129.1 aldose epimerase [Corynebacterium sp.]